MSAEGESLGRAGRPLRHTPLRFGFLAAIGALAAYAGFLALRHIGSILTMLLAAGTGLRLRAAVRARGGIPPPATPIGW